MNAVNENQTFAAFGIGTENLIEGGISVDDVNFVVRVLGKIVRNDAVETDQQFCRQRAIVFRVYVNRGETFFYGRLKQRTFGINGVVDVLEHYVRRRIKLAQANDYACDVGFCGSDCVVESYRRPRGFAVIKHGAEIGLQ